MDTRQIFYGNKYRCEWMFYYMFGNICGGGTIQTVDIITHMRIQRIQQAIIWDLFTIWLQKLIKCAVSAVNDRRKFVSNKQVNMITCGYGQERVPIRLYFFSGHFSIEAYWIIHFLLIILARLLFIRVLKSPFSFHHEGPINSRDVDGSFKSFRSAVS